MVIILQVLYLCRREFQYERFKCFVKYNKMCLVDVWQKRFSSRYKKKAFVENATDMIKEII